MKYKVLAILWMALIFVSSSIPSYEFPEVSFWGWAKLVHLVYFGVLCFLFRQILQDQKKVPTLANNPILFGILFATCYGMSDEFHQMFTPGRHAQVTDVVVDALGACLYVAGAKAVEFFRLKSAKAT